MKEKKTQTEILLKIGGRKDTRLFRNSVGVGMLRNGSYVRFGLAKGSGDLIGWHSLIVTEEMVGKRIALFLSIEVKAPKGLTSKEQKIWEQIVNESGGIALVARSPEDVEKILGLLNAKAQTK